MGASGTLDHNLKVLCGLDALAIKFILNSGCHLRKRDRNQQIFYHGKLSATVSTTISLIGDYLVQNILEYCEPSDHVNILLYPIWKTLNQGEKQRNKGPRYDVLLTRGDETVTIKYI